MCQRLIAVIEIQSLVGFVVCGGCRLTGGKVQSDEVALLDVAGEPVFGGVLCANGGSISESTLGHTGARL